MGSIFSSCLIVKKNKHISQLDEVTLNLKSQKDRLIKYQKKINLNIEELNIKIKILLKENKLKLAKIILKKKKLQGKLIENAFGQQNNIEKMINSLEESQIDINVYNALKEGFFFKK